MPRTGRGGKRAGTPGKVYANRSDLNNRATLPVQAASGQQYGKAKEQMDAQRSIPLPNNATTPNPSASPNQTIPPPILPGELGAFDRPSERPYEPVTTGLSSGPGPGPEILTPYMGDDTGAKLRALYYQFPNPDLADLIEVFDVNRNS